MAAAPSFSQRLSHLSATRADELALTVGAVTLTTSQLDRRANAMARHFADLGVRHDHVVTIAEPNSVEFIVAIMAAWKLGAIPGPVSHRLPAKELEAIVELADSAVVVGMDSPGRVSVPRGFTPPSELDDSPLADAVASSWKAPTSGGSTGRPKLILAGDPSVYTDHLSGFAASVGASEGGCMVVPGPLYHNGPFMWSSFDLLAGCHLVLLERFDAEATLAAVQEHRATSIYLVPTMMQRIWKLPVDVRSSYDVSSLEIAYHLGEPCPRWLKRAWIDWLGPEVLWELYAGTESQARTVISGTDWLDHEGSVGRAVKGSITIRDSEGTVLPPGEAGDVWLRPPDPSSPTYRYIGAEAQRLGDWECLGDVGWMDEDGYLYLGDRRTDMILTGGANVYPAEVESALNEHPLVSSAAVIGLPDPEWGSRVHAIVEAGGVTEADLVGFLEQRLVSYKIPRTFEFVHQPLRDDAGKVRRSALRAERVS